MPQDASGIFLGSTHFSSSFVSGGRPEPDVEETPALTAPSTSALRNRHEIMLMMLVVCIYYPETPVANGDPTLNIKCARFRKRK